MRPVTVLVAGDRHRRYCCADCDPLKEPAVEAVVRDPWRDDS
jgi:hypothetical protein